MTTINITLRQMLWVPAFLLLAALVQIVYWVQDDDPPFRTISYTATPVRAGENMRIQRKVWRDASRSCRITYTRNIIDSHGIVAQLLLQSPVSRQEREINIRDAPDTLSELVHIPTGLSPGPAKIRTILQYWCNPVQELWSPIAVETVLDVEILP